MKMRANKENSGTAKKLEHLTCKTGAKGQGTTQAA